MGGPDDFYANNLGASGKAGFYGTTPIAKQTITLTTATATTGSNEATINAILAALVALGLVDSTGP
jgi:hypothetical protein